MSEAARDLPYTLEDWIELEKTAHVRHEFEDGVFRAMSGGNESHNLITLNLSDALKPLAKKHGCRRYGIDYKTLANGKGYYPDSMLACAPRGASRYVEPNPCFIAEVLSPTSIQRDTVEKRQNYLLIPSLEQYVMVYTTEIRVEVYRRRVGFWQFTELKALSDALEIVCLNESITLEQIYEDVILEPETQESNQD